MSNMSEIAGNNVAPMAQIAMQVVAIPIEMLRIAHDFRLDDNMLALGELAASIKSVGLLQPITVRALGGGSEGPDSLGWEVIAGRRRLAASRLAGLTSINCVVVNVGDDKADEIALVENLHRLNLSPVEEALAYQRLQASGLTQTEIARRVGRSLSHIHNMFRLLKLPQYVQDRIHRKEIGYVSALKHYTDQRTGHRGGKNNKKDYDVGAHSTSDQVASHWRQRHDRLINGLHVIKKAKVETAKCPGCKTNVMVPAIAQFKSMVDKLIQLDMQPLTTEEEDRDNWRDRW